MIRFNARSNVRQWSRRMTRVERRQVPFATSLALNETAGDIKRNTEKSLERRLDRPTPFTRRGLYIRRATKRRLVAVVGFKRIQAAYLDKPERGGVRRPRRRALVLPAGARLNRYGNFPRNAISRLLARDDTFSGTVNGVAGIWQRKRRGGLKLLAAYEARATYKPQLKFRSSAYKTAVRRFPHHWRRSMRRALRTAK